MKPKERINALEEINLAEEEAGKYYLGEGWYTAIQDHNDPKVFWLKVDEKEIQVLEEELEKYSKFSNIISVRHTIEYVKK